MEKRTWSTPAAVAEQFVANEYVNACWSVECIIPDSNDPITGSSNNQPSGWNGLFEMDYHNPNECGNPEHQYIRDIGNDKYEVTEFKSNGAELDAMIYQGTFTQDQITGSNAFNPSNTNANMWGSSIKLTADNEGQYIFWRTEYLGSTYYHYGVVDLINSNRTAQHS